MARYFEAQAVSFPMHLLKFPSHLKTLTEEGKMPSDGLGASHPKNLSAHFTRQEFSKRLYPNGGGEGEAHVLLHWWVATIINNEKYYDGGRLNL